jgi:hypothetical protein
VGGEGGGGAGPVGAGVGVEKELKGVHECGDLGGGTRGGIVGGRLEGGWNVALAEAKWRCQREERDGDSSSQGGAAGWGLNFKF